MLKMLEKNKKALKLKEMNLTLEQRKAFEIDSMG